MDYDDNWMYEDEEQALVTGQRCPVCACPIEEHTEDDPLEICPRCNTAHHKDCWDYNGGCAVYACRDAEPPDKVEIESWPTVLQDYRSWLQLTRLSRRATMVFVISCLIAAHLALLGTYAGIGGLTILLPLIPMFLSGTAFALLEKKAYSVKEQLEGTTGSHPFDEVVSARDAVRWMAGAKKEVGDLDWKRYLNYFWILGLAFLLNVSVASVLPFRALAFLGLFNCFVLFMVGDSYRSMRKEQSILIERFKSTFQPRLEEGKKGKEPIEIDDETEYL